MSEDIRTRLVSTALKWEELFGVAPAITRALSEYDASQLVKMPIEEYRSGCKHRTAVTRGHDFTYGDCKYQVKANRPSGKPGSRVTKVVKARIDQNDQWDKLIWILYNEAYELQEAWEWTFDEYRDKFEGAKRLSPNDMRKGKRIPTSLTFQNLPNIAPDITPML